jgi:signal transduction histidine kinase
MIKQALTWIKKNLRRLLPNRSWSSMSLALQIRVALTLLAIVGTLGVGSLLTYSSTQVQIETLNQLQVARSRAISEQINTYLEDFQRKLGYLSRVTGLAELPLEVQKSLIEALIRHDSAYELVAILDRSGNPVTYVSPYRQETLTNQGKNIAFSRAYHWAEDYIGWVDLETIGDRRLRLITFSVPIRDRADRVAGVLLARVNLDFLDSVVRDAWAGEAGYTYLIDARNVVLTLSNADPKRFTPLNLDQTPLAHRLSESLTGEVSRYQGLNREDVMGTVTDIPSINWRVVAELPIADAYAPLRDLLAKMIAGSLVSGAAAGWLSWRWAHRTLYPLQLLTTKIAKLDRNSLVLNPQIEIEHLTSKHAHNEIGILSRAFQEMAQRLHESFAALGRANEELEQRVLDRTMELQQALDDLKKTQIQLIQIEKMSSLGQLVAGLAHEINNPLSFIFGNLGHAQSYFQDLIDLQDLSVEIIRSSVKTAAYPSDLSLESSLEILPIAIREKWEEIDYDFIKEDFPRLLKSMKHGAIRIRDLIQNLRDFARLDESEVKLVDLNLGLENTLVVLQNRLGPMPYRSCFNIHRDLSDLPLIRCYPAQINQVFLQIISNAIDTIDASGGNTNPHLWLRSQVQDDRIIIAIRDNGSGIPDHVLPKIFDPFFTTKPVGQGTGLGLSISHQIVVETHGGSLIAKNHPEGGAEFTIELPLVGVSAPTVSLQNLNSSTTGLTDLTDLTDPT